MNKNNAPILCLHASASTSRQWRPLRNLLANQYDVIAPDLYGYGQAPPPPTPFSIEVESALALSHLTTDQPFHLVGHSYGGHIALHIAHQQPERVLSLSLYEPALFAPIAATNPDTYHEVRQALDKMHWLVAAGQCPQAAACFIDYWVGKNAWSHMSERARQTVIAAMPKCDLEWSIVFSKVLDSTKLRTIDIPTRLLTGTRSTAAAQIVTRLLQRHLPQAHTVELTNLKHMAPVTDAAIVNDHIASFLYQNDRRKRPIMTSLAPRRIALTPQLA